METESQCRVLLSARPFVIVLIDERDDSYEIGTLWTGNHLMLTVETAAVLSFSLHDRDIGS